ncbi:MAG: acetyl-CoA carboxylase carboxyltransferase subunit alpha [Phycisphaeraceae bacterium]|nr:acetyl-CoA carboxylase carboxyltransferase subunit alpha [Phycisphaeraceae bacterium]
MTSLSGTLQPVYELEFERPLSRLEQQIAELEAMLKLPPAPPLPGAATDAQTTGPRAADLAPEIRRLREAHTSLLRKTYENLSPWHVVKVARHPNRPQSTDYLQAICKNFTELHGDRAFGDDQAIAAGLARIGPHKVMVLAHRKGRDTKERIACNFGMAHPEGYRKALLKMKLAEKFNLPVVTLIDTPGAFPGIGAEERGQAEAIAVNLREMSRLRVPILSVVIGEGGSGGALGIGVADRAAMMQYAWYSVISPEACAAILWKTGAEAEKAAAALRLTARDNLELGVVDAVIEEPLGGAHRNPSLAADRLEQWITKNLREIVRLPIDTLLEKRYERWRKLGQTVEVK